MLTNGEIYAKIRILSNFFVDPSIFPTPIVQYSHNVLSILLVNHRYETRSLLILEPIIFSLSATEMYTNEIFGSLWSPKYFSKMISNGFWLQHVLIMSSAGDGLED